MISAFKIKDRLLDKWTCSLTLTKVLWRNSWIEVNCLILIDLGKESFFFHSVFSVTTHWEQPSLTERLIFPYARVFENTCALLFWIQMTPWVVSAFNNARWVHWFNVDCCFLQWNKMFSMAARFLMCERLCQGTNILLCLRVFIFIIRFVTNLCCNHLIFCDIWLWINTGFLNF